MITHETMRELLVGNLRSFILVSDGKAELTNQMGYGLGLLVAMNHAAAKKMADAVHAAQGRQLSVAAVGSVQGETLANHIALAVLGHGAKGCYVTDDGETMQFFLAPPVPKD
jgi:hypothetical protein